MRILSSVGFAFVLASTMLVAGCKEPNPNYYQNEETNSYQKHKNKGYENEYEHERRDLVKECIRDNRSEGQRRHTVAKYCNCMKDTMPSHETRSIESWEKHHPRAQEKCEREAGWR
ncbi:MAG: hypothetical protein HQL95_09750 [Magnetococcales bacterium]|nr:hypothetical protein [Magnetococcales bacterium]